jgi:hypothetical protein
VTFLEEVSTQRLVGTLLVYHWVRTVVAPVASFQINVQGSVYVHVQVKVNGKRMALAIVEHRGEGSPSGVAMDRRVSGIQGP